MKTLLFIFLLSNQVFADTIKAELFSTSDQPDFFYTRQDNVENDKLRKTSKFEDRKGNTVATELVEFDGKDETSALRRYTLKQIQSHSDVEVVRENQKFSVTVKTEGKVTAETFGTDLLLPPQIPFELLRHLDLMLQGETYKFKLLIPDIRQTITMSASLAKTAETEPIRIKLQVSNLAISMFVSPVYFSFDRTSHRLAFVEGRTLLLDSKGNPWVGKTVMRQ